MKCPECRQGELRVTHTIRATEKASTRTRVCDHCKMRFSEVSVITPASGRGSGAEALAGKLRRGARINDLLEGS